MTKQEIMYTIIKVIFIGLIGSLSKSFFDNIVGKYMPDKKKLNSYIRKFFLFNLRYTLIVFFLTKSFIDDRPIDKIFIFTTCIYFSVLIFNILTDMLLRFLDRTSKVFDSQAKVFDRQQDLNKSLYEVNSSFIDTNKDVLAVLGKITDAMKDHLIVTKEIASKDNDKK